MGRHRDRSSLALLLSAVATVVLWYGRPTRQTSYTILTMTYEKRGALVEGFIGHYDTCGGLDSILVVWNGPDMESTIDTAHIHATSRVPVRFRAEGKPSLNNRYRPDPHLSDIDALLILDDDLRIDCDSVQRALGAFHRSRRQDIVGWFPRFAMLGTPHSYYLGEPRTIKRGEYNLILSGAAFVDHRRYFELYWAPELAEMRAVVDVRSHLSDTFADSPLAHPLTHSFVRRSRSGTAMICCLILWSQQLAEGATTSGPAPSQTSLARLAWGSVMTRMALYGRPRIVSADFMSILVTRA
jgi:hypothetical protein